MHIRNSVLFCVFVIATFFLQPLANAQSRDAYESLRSDWHLAGISEYEGLWSSAIDYYQKSIEDSRILPLDIHEWYTGTAYYGISRCLSRSNGDSLAIRKSLSEAFAHHFWNFDLVKTDSQELSKCGVAWVDSCWKFWNAVAVYERPLWREQVPIVFYPNGYDSTARWPLLVALHGGNGNYQSFAEHWLDMADQLKAVIVIPAGAIRESQITNSWGSDMTVVSKVVLKVVNDFTSKHLADPKEIYLAGFSQGAQASIELSLLRPDIFRGAIAMSGFVDRLIPDSTLKVARERGVRLFEITGQFEDPTFHQEIDSVHRQCVRLGIPFQMSTSTGMIHEVPLDFPSQILRAWSWVRSEPEAARVNEN